MAFKGALERGVELLKTSDMNWKTEGNTAYINIPKGGRELHISQSALERVMGKPYIPQLNTSVQMEYLAGGLMFAVAFICFYYIKRLA
jgi:hypothetical protein